MSSAIILRKFYGTYETSSRITPTAKGTLYRFSYLPSTQPPAVSVMRDAVSYTPPPLPIGETHLRLAARQDAARFPQRCWLNDNGYRFAGSGGGLVDGEEGAGLVD